jgi:hypothetical protein
MMQEESTKLSVWIETSIREFVKSQENCLGTQEHEPAWADPLVGFSRGADALYFQFKKDSGPFYWTPLRYLKNISRGKNQSCGAYCDKLDSAADRKNQAGQQKRNATPF